MAEANLQLLLSEIPKRSDHEAPGNKPTKKKNTNKPRNNFRFRISDPITWSLSWSPATVDARYDLNATNRNNIGIRTPNQTGIVRLVIADIAVTKAMALSLIHI